jgi:hypothetical protein
MTARAWSVCRTSTLERWHVRLAQNLQLCLIESRDSMFKMIHSASLRLRVLPWLVTCVLITPLFHIHTLDVQEARSFSRIFLVHTVFSPDLAGEYSPQSTVPQGRTQNNQEAFSTHFAHYSEGTFTLISEDDLKREKGFEPVLQAYFSPPKYLQQNAGQYVIPDLISPPFALSVSSFSLRAPPSASV